MQSCKSYNVFNLSWIQDEQFPQLTYVRTTNGCARINSLHRNLSNKILSQNATYYDWYMFLAFGCKSMEYFEIYTLVVLVFWSRQTKLCTITTCKRREKKIVFENALWFSVQNSSYKKIGNEGVLRKFWVWSIDTLFA